MKPTKIAVGCLLAGAAPQLMAASLLMDDFTGPALQLGSNPPLPRGFQSANDAPVAANRHVQGSLGPAWIVTQNPTEGTLTYSFNMLRGQPNSSDSLSFMYSYADRLASFVGLDAVQLQVDSIAGTGLVSAYVPTGTTIEELKISLVPGTTVVPLLNPSGADPMRNIVIRIYPTTPNFSLTLSSLWLVPEPGSGLLAATAAVWLTSRRRRDHRAS
jgi:hypothetical protein